MKDKIIILKKRLKNKSEINDLFETKKNLCKYL